MDIIRVSATSRLSAVAGAISGVIREHRQAEVDVEIVDKIIDGRGISKTQAFLKSLKFNCAAAAWQDISYISARPHKGLRGRIEGALPKN